MVAVLIFAHILLVVVAVLIFAHWTLVNLFGSVGRLGCGAFGQIWLGQGWRVVGGLAGWPAAFVAVAPVFCG